MIKLSANSALIPGEPIEGVLEFYREIGIRRLELIQFMHGDAIEQAGPAELSALLARHDMELAALYCRPIDIWDDERLERSVAGVVRACGIAEAMGANRVVFPPLLPREGYDYGRLVRALRRVIDGLGGREVYICLENHHGWPMDLPEDYRLVLGEVDDARVAVAFDTGHFTASNVELVRLVHEFGSRIRHVHLKDHIGTRSVPFGAGVTDNLGAVRALREVGYEGYASIELEVDDPENVRAYLRDAVAYTNEVLGLD